MPEEVATGLWIAGPFLGAALLMGLIYSGWRWGVVPMPTSWQVQKLCVHLVREQLGDASGVVMDLGSGFGTMARAMARAIPQAEVRAVEGSRLVFVLGLVATWARRVFWGRSAPVKWQRADLLSCDLHGCSGVFCYLYRGIMPELSQKLRAELAPGSWVVSNTFALPGWEPEVVVRAADIYKSPVYVYRVAQTKSGLHDRLTEL